MEGSVSYWGKKRKREFLLVDGDRVLKQVKRDKRGILVKLGDGRRTKGSVGLLNSNKEGTGKPK